MKQTPELRGFHDLLKASLAAQGKSCPEGCVFCATEHDLEEPVADKTYTEDELQAKVTAAVATAVAAAQSESAAARSELETAQRQGAIDAAVATALEAQAGEVARLQTDLDAKTLEATAEKARADAADQAETDRLAAAEEATTLAATKDSRIAEVREIAKYDGVEDLITSSGDRWASMTDADFETVKDSLKAVAAKVPAPSRPIPRATSSMTAAEEPGGDKGGAQGRTALQRLRDHQYASAGRSA